MPFLPKTLWGKASFFIKYFRATLKFYMIYRKLRAKGFPYEIPKEDRETMKLLGQPLDRFMKDNNLNYLIDIVSQRFAAYGYGRLSEVPTYYGLLLLEKNFLSRPKYVKFGNGNSTLWKLVVDKYQLEVKKEYELIDLNHSEFKKTGLVHTVFNHRNKKISDSFSSPESSNKSNTKAL